MKHWIIILLKYLILLILIGGVTAGVAWARTLQQNEVCNGMVVKIINPSEIQFLNEAGIISDLNEAGVAPVGTKLSKIDLLGIENALNQYDYLENAQCVLKSNNMLEVEVKQMIPVMRIFDSEGNSHYVNIEGKSLRADPRYHIDVPIVLGNILGDSSAVADIMQIINYLDKNPEMHAYVSAIKYVNPQNIYIIPSISGHVVNLGNSDNIDGKFAKLEKFYREVIPEKGWWAYDTISVKWNYQVVANRRNKMRKQIVEIVDVDPDEDISTLDTLTTKKQEAPKAPPVAKLPQKKSQATTTNKGVAANKTSKTKKNKNN